MPLGDEGSAFVIFDRKEGVFEQAKFSCVLRFTSKEIDPSTGEPEEEGYDDEYTLEDVNFKLTSSSVYSSSYPSSSGSPVEGSISFDVNLRTQENFACSKTPSFRSKITKAEPSSPRG